MYVKNTSNKEIKLRSFEGYSFRIPQGVSWIWDKAGEHLLEKVYNVEPKPKEDKYGYNNGFGVPALTQSTEAAWEKGGKKLTQVERFKISASLIPRSPLIKVAKQRGISNDRVMEYLTDSNIDAQIIAEEINQLPVPEELRFPKNLEKDNKLEVNTTTA